MQAECTACAETNSIRALALQKARKKECVRGLSIIEKELVDWLWDMYEKNLYTIDIMREELARKVMNEVKDALPSRQRLFLNFSNDWSAHTVHFGCTNQAVTNRADRSIG